MPQQAGDLGHRCALPPATPREKQVLKCALGAAHAQTIVIDDFNRPDGPINEGWTHYAPPNLAPGIFVVEDGELHMRSEGLVPPEDGSNWLGSGWDTSEDPNFSNGFITMKTQFNTDGSSSVAGMRMSVDGNSAYFFEGGNTTHSFAIARCSAGGWTWYVIPGVTMNPGEEWMIEGGVVEDLISMKVWRPGEPEPASPQLTFIDRQPLPANPLGVLSWVDVRSDPILIDATFDDIYFTFPVRGDFNSDRLLDVEDIDLLTDELTRPTPRYRPQFDLNKDQSVDLADHEMWVHQLKNTWFGDGDLNGEFNTGDLVQVLMAGKYETQRSAGWAEGDWNGDGRFGTGDLVKALEDGGYELGPRPDAAAVPEPTSVLLLVMGLLGLVILRLPRGS